MSGGDDQQDIDLPNFSIMYMRDPNKIWLEYKTGEGMEMTVAALESMLKKYWDENF